MAAEPEIVQRSEQPYLAIRAFVTLQTLGQVLPSLHPEVAGWLGARGIVPAGAPFCRYDVIDMDRQLEIEVGFPVAAPVPGDGRVQEGVLPAGQYVTAWHTGHPSGLAEATGALLDWAAQQGLTWDVTTTADGDKWGCRLEISHDEPGQDMSEWVTELAFKLAG